VNFISELKRRNVIRVAGAYLVVAWLIIQLTEQMVPAFHLPEWSNTFVIMMLGIGLPITMLVAWAFEMTPEGLRRTQETESHRHLSSSRARLGDYVIILGVLIVAGYVFYDHELVKAPDGDAALQVGKIAVLPFASFSPEPEQEGVSRAMTFEVRNRLVQIPGLRVVAGAAALEPGEVADLKAVGEALGAEVVLDGSVQKSGSTLRVMAQLVDTREGVQLWSETFNREMTDVLAVQDDISQAIVNEVHAAITPEEERAPPGTVRGRTAGGENPHLRSGLAELAARSPQGLERGVETLREAVGRSPDSATAHAALAEAYLLQAASWGTYGPLSPDRAVALARPFISRALALDPDLAAGKAVKALAALVSGHPDEAIPDLEAAIAADSSMAKARLWLSYALDEQGRRVEASRELEQAYRQVPDDLPVALGMSRLLAHRGESLEADELLRRLDREHPGNRTIVQARAARLGDQWRPADVIKALTGTEEGLDSIGRGLLGLSYLDLGMTEKAAELLPGGQVAAYLASGRPQDALDEAWRRFREDPGDRARIFDLAAASAAAGQPGTAVDLLSPLLVDAGHGGPLYTGSPAFLPVAVLAAARKAAGDGDGAEEALAAASAWLQEQRQAGFDGAELDYLEARIAAVRGNVDAALVSLRRAAGAGFLGVSALAWDPALAGLHGSGEFTRLKDELDAERRRQRERLDGTGMATYAPREENRQLVRGVSGDMGPTGKTM
jgi:TolB-like protein/tetratricopeptide (TPR) repeat protein